MLEYTSQRKFNKHCAVIKPQGDQRKMKGCIPEANLKVQGW